jgi:ABC-type multidrug transport system ATPase subunit
VTWLGGDEGSGKTTLLQLLAGVLPTAGHLQILGLSLTDNRPAYQQQVAWLDPQGTALDGQTARQIFAALPRAPTAGGPSQNLDRHIDGLSLEPHLDKTLTMLSTGTRRKVLLAAALAAEAPVTLLDQPFKALDRPSIDYLLALLAEAAPHPHRAWVVADYVAPPGVALAGVIALRA